MKIKLAMLDSDRNYLNRISATFSSKYADKIEIYSFTDVQTALKNIETAKVDVFAANEAFDIDTKMLSQKCVFAYLVEKSEITRINDRRTILKYQSINLFYRQVLDLYSDKVSSVTGFKQSDSSDIKIVTFLSAAGGVGSSLMAVSFAKRMAGKGKKTLYLDLEKIGCVDSFLSGKSQADFSDVIYAVKSKKTNLGFKLESAVSQDESGVFFYAQPKTVLDLIEFEEDDLKTMLKQLKADSNYEYIVVDTDFSFSKKVMSILKESIKVVFVSDGKTVSNAKTQSVYRALLTLETQSDLDISSKTALMYNKLSSDISLTCDDMGLKCIGGAPLIEDTSIEVITDRIAQMNIFDELFN